MFRMKVYRQGREVLVAASDSDIIGQTFRGDGLRIAVTEAFYGTEEADAQTLLQQLRACTIANLVGERVIALAIEHGYVSEERVIRIGGVPHAQYATL